MIEKKKYNQKTTIQDIHDYCNQEGIKLKFIGEDNELKNSESKLTFLCLNCEEVYINNFKRIKNEKVKQCGNCGKKSNKRHKTQREESFKKVLELCQELSLICLSSEYENNQSDLEFECTKCSNPFLRRWSVLQDTHNTICLECSYKLRAEDRRYGYEEVAQIFEDGGCELLTTEYRDNKQKLEYVCDCGEIATICLSNFIYGQRCETCARIKRANTKRTSYEEIKEFFENEGCILLSESFTSSNLPLEYICSCGEIAKTTWSRYSRSAHKCCVNCANKLGGEKMRGENHPFWNPNLTEQDRISRRYDERNKIWRYAVYERDNYTCQCCGDASGGNLRAHHKEGYNWCKERRFDVANGITLCDLHHKEFHGIYGYGNNTEQQIEEYLKEHSSYLRDKEVV